MAHPHFIHVRKHQRYFHLDGLVVFAYRIYFATDIAPGFFDAQKNFIFENIFYFYRVHYFPKE